jgi:hypothetical protein
MPACYPDPDEWMWYQVALDGFPRLTLGDAPEDVRKQTAAATSHARAMLGWTREKLAAFDPEKLGDVAGKDAQFCWNACRQTNYRRLQHSGEWPTTKSRLKILTFQLGAMESGIALVLGYATSLEKRSKGEMGSFAIGMTREKAAELRRALLEIAGKAPEAGGPRRTEH